jgi:hypothetical protein
MKAGPKCQAAEVGRRSSGAAVKPDGEHGQSLRHSERQTEARVPLVRNPVGDPAAAARPAGFLRPDIPVEQLETIAV